jgi:hypothetical protein
MAPRAGFACPFRRVKALFHRIVDALDMATPDLSYPLRVWRQRIRHVIG